MKSFKCILILIFIPVAMFSKDIVYFNMSDIDHYYFYNSELSNISFSNEIGPKKIKKPKRKKPKRKKPKRKKPKKIPNRTPLAIKSNLVFAAALTPNLALELPIKKHFSIELSSTYNIWDMKGNVKWKNLVLMSEFRYWPKKNMEGWFYGINVNWAKYNIGGIPMPYFAEADYYRYDGWTMGAGVSAGYMWYLSKHWSFEANVGLGVNYTSYDKYLQPEIGRAHV